MRKFLLLLLASALAFPLNWSAALKEAEPGEEGAPPTLVVLIFVYHVPLVQDLQSGNLRSCLVRIVGNDLYETLKIFSENDAKVTVAISPSMLEQISSLALGAEDPGYRGKCDIKLGWCEEDVNECIMPPEMMNGSMKLEVVKNIEKGMMAGIPGVMISLSSKNLTIAALPLYSAPLSWMVGGGLSKDAKEQFEKSVAFMRDMFGDVKVAFPPTLHPTHEVLGMFKTAGMEYSFAAISYPSIVDGVKMVPVDEDISRKILEVENERDLADFLSEIHRKEGTVGIVVDGLLWSLKSWNVRIGIIKALLNDEWIELAGPQDLKYMGRARLSASKQPAKSQKLWDYLKGVFITFVKSCDYLSGERKEAARKLILALEDYTFYRLAGSSSDLGDRLLDLYDSMVRDLYTYLGEDYSKVPSVKTMLRSECIPMKVEGDVSLDGMNAEGFWKYSCSLESEGARLMVIEVNKRLIVYVSFPWKARDMIGKSRLVELVTDEVTYKFYLKTWRGRVYVFKNDVLDGKLESGFGIWDGLEMELPNRPKEIAVRLVDTRKDSVILRIPQEGFLRLAEGRE